MLRKHAATTASAALLLVTCTSCATAATAQTGKTAAPKPPQVHIADLDGPHTVTVTRTVSKPTVIEGEKVCADHKPDLLFWNDPENVPERWRMARIIWEEANEADAPVRARVVAYAAAIQESNLQDMTGGHADSIGLYQMRPSFPDQWGTPTELDSPEYQADRFFEVLFRQTPDWADKRITDAAQDVLRSAYPEAYADHVDEGAAIVGWLSDTGCGPVTLTRTLRVA